MDELDNVQHFEQYLRRRFPDRRTAIDYVSDVRQFIAICPKPWREVTMHDIDQFVDQQREAQRKPATIKRRVAALKTYFDFLAEDSGELHRPNPVRFKRYAGKQPRRLPRDLSDETVEQVWNTIASPRDRAWFALMVRAGLRVGEVVRLRLTDVLASPQADRPARLCVSGKGQKERVVLLMADAYAVLKAWLQVRPASEQPYVFLNDRGRCLTANGIEWLLHHYGEQTGVALTPHQLRHTYARQLTEAGMPITSLSKLMGHAQVSTTQLYTAGADPELVRAYQTAMTQLTRQALPALESLQPTPTPPEAPPPLSLPTAPSVAFTPAPLPEWAKWMPDLPAELRQASLAYTQHSLSTCKPHRQRQKAFRILGEFRRFWNWQLARQPITHLAELHLTDLQAYQTERQAEGAAAATIDRSLDHILGLLREQADRGLPIDHSVFRLRPLPRPDSLPRALTEEDYQRLEAYVQNRLTCADPLNRLENACFLILAHTGVRTAECVDLLFQDLDLVGGRLTVRQGKGQRDRVVYLSDLARRAMQTYLGDTPHGPTDLLWTRPTGKPLTDGWLQDHIAALGQAAGVPDVSPQRLRHTLATRLLNAGMDITRIQKLLGHEHISTTMIYARVHDATVELDYRQAMSKIERQHMPLADAPVPVANWPTRTIAEHEQIFKEPALDNSV
jgi:site-specific recombinase XerD